MACSQSNPCGQVPDCGSNAINPCYENCGCLYPSTFDCVENFKQRYPFIGLNIGDDLQDLVGKLETILSTMQSQINSLTTTTTTIP